MSNLNSSFWMRTKLLIDSRKSSGTLIPILIFLNASITLFLSRINVDTDEVYSLDTSSQSLEYALHQALYFEQQSPLYFIILNLWRSFNSSIFFARFFSVICIALAIYIIPALSKRFLREIHPGWITTCVALNPFVIWAALEIRLYGFAILLSALLLLLFFDGYVSDIPKTKARWLYLICSVLALYTQYYFGFFLVANAITLLILRRWYALRSYLLGMIIVGICFAPMLLIIPHQLFAATQSAIAVAPPEKNSFLGVLLKGLKYILQRIAFYIFSGTKQTYLTANLKIIFIPVFCIVVLRFIKKIQRSVTVRNLAILVTTFALYVCFFALSSLVPLELIEARHTTVFFLPTILSIFVIVKGIPKKNALIIWTIITMFFYSTSLYTFYQPMAKIGDWDRVATYLMTSEKTNQAILAFTPEVATALTYYYSGSNSIVPIPKKLDFQAYSLRDDYVLKDEKQIATALSSIPGDRQFIWLVNYASNTSVNANYHLSILEEFIEKHYSVESSKDFFGSTVRLLHRKSSS